MCAGAGPAHNDVTERARIWRRFPGDDWAAYEALPAAIRRRLQQHAYDVWAVNALVMWRAERRRTASGARAERRVLRWLDLCESEERAAFAAAFAARHGSALPHLAAGARVLRAGDTGAPGQASARECRIRTSVLSDRRSLSP